MDHYWWLCYQAWERNNALLDAWRYNSPSWILQRQVTEAKSGVAPMRNWGFVHICSHKTFQPLHHSVSPQNMCHYRQKTMRAGYTKALQGRILFLPLSYIFPLYSKSLSGCPTIATSRRFRKYYTWLRQQEWRREQQTFVPNLKLDYTNSKNQWPSIINMETLLLLFTTRSALINIQAECPDLRRI